MFSNGESTTDLRFFLRIAAFLALILINSRSVLGQSDFADISGVISQPGTGGETVLPGEQVKLTRLSTDQVRTATTDGVGRYMFAALDPDTYEISVRDKSQPVTLLSGQSRTVNLSLPISPSFQTIIPTPTPSPTPTPPRVAILPDFAPLKINRGRLGMTLTASEITQSPYRGLDGQRLLLQAPGASLGGAGVLSFIAIPEEQAVLRVRGVDTGPLVFIPSGSFLDNRPFALGLLVRTGCS
jgi:hypothetical protein